MTLSCHSRTCFAWAALAAPWFFPRHPSRASPSPSCVPTLLFWKFWVAPSPRSPRGRYRPRLGRPLWFITIIRYPERLDTCRLVWFVRPPAPRCARQQTHAHSHATRTTSLPSQLVRSARLSILVCRASLVAARGRTLVATVDRGQLLQQQDPRRRSDRLGSRRLRLSREAS